MSTGTGGTEASFFVGIGAPKCGTTWLWRYLQHHPQVLSHPIKEMHVFDTRLEGNRQARIERQRRSAARVKHPDSPRGRSILAAREEAIAIYAEDDPEVAARRYRDYFASRLDASIRAYGEITPSYCRLPTEGFRLIEETMPGARYFLVMRDPIDRFVSGVAHIVREQAGGASPSEIVRSQIDNPRFLAYSRYDLTLAHLEAVVDRGRVSVLVFEELTDGTRHQLSRLTDFLGIDQLDPPEGLATTESGREQQSDEERAASRPTLDDDARTRLGEAFAPTYAAVAERLGRLPNGWRSGR